MTEVGNFYSKSSLCFAYLAAKEGSRFTVWGSGEMIAGSYLFGVKVYLPQWETEMSTPLSLREKLIVGLYKKQSLNVGKMFIQSVHCKTMLEGYGGYPYIISRDWGSLFF